MTDRLTKIFNDFFNDEKNGGIILVLCSVLSIMLANTSFGLQYSAFWHSNMDLSFPGIALDFSIEKWINDGLMAVFFLLVGLEIERELYAGELSSLKKAMLPAVAALGGMLVPALIHISLNAGTVSQSGFGIPVATDIAFSLGALALLGKRVPLSLRILLASLAIIDDLGAVIVIALFYNQNVSFLYLGATLAVFAMLRIFNSRGVNNLLFYIVPGIMMWYFMLQSGIHASIAGVLLAFAVPFGKGDDTSPSFRLQKYLTKPVPFLVLPLFALANTAVIFSADWHSILFSSNGTGILCGLVLGKPVGILLFAFFAVRTGLCDLPSDLNWRYLAGGGMLAGIGFTMSIFIANIAFSDLQLVSNSKIAILAASVIAGTIGLLYLSAVSKKRIRAGKAY
jgi:NhaA family Na+:H+ antiporter